MSYYTALQELLKTYPCVEKPPSVDVKYNLTLDFEVKLSLIVSAPTDKEKVGDLVMKIRDIFGDMDNIKITHNDEDILRGYPYKIQPELKGLSSTSYKLYYEPWRGQIWLHRKKKWRKQPRYWVKINISRPLTDSTSPNEVNEVIPLLDALDKYIQSIK